MVFSWLWNGNHLSNSPSVRKDIFPVNSVEHFFSLREANEDLIDVLGSPHISLEYAPEPQGETIAWANHKNGFYTLSEKIKR